MDDSPLGCCGGHLCGFLTFIQIAHGHVVQMHPTLVSDMVSLKSRAVDQSTTQFCCHLVKCHGTYFPFINSVLGDATNQDMLLLGTLR